MECIKLLMDVYDDNLKSSSRVFEWHKRFSEGREEWKMINNPDHPSILKTDQNIQKISETVRKVRPLIVIMIAGMMGTNRETVRQTLRKKRPKLWKNSLNAASRQCPSSQRPFALEVSSQ